MMRFVICSNSTSPLLILIDFLSSKAEGHYSLLHRKHLQFWSSEFVRVLINKARYLLTIILHRNHRIYVGTWYETCSSAHVSETVIVLHHGQPGGFHCPACLYLLHSPSAAMRVKMGITCALSASNSAEHCKTIWVLVTLQRLAHTTPQVHIPHICLHFLAAALQEIRLFQAHSLLCHCHANNI